MASGEIGRPVVAQINSFEYVDIAPDDPRHWFLEKAKNSGIEQSIGPLNAYERRLVHLAVAEVPGVTSESIGDAAVKTVTITAVK